MVNLLTEQNVQASLARLKDSDILVQPDLGTITFADFERHAEAAERGRAAAERVVPRLAALALDEPRYAAWREQRLAGVSGAPPRIDEVQVGGLVRASEEALRRYVEQRADAPLDAATLQRDLLRAYGDGWYESVDYVVQRAGGRTLLRILPVEKSWGPDYLRLGLRLDSNLSQGSTYQLRAALQRTWLNALGGELLLTGELGSSTGAGVEWFQPLTRDRRWFADALAEYRRERTDVWFVEQRVAEYRSARTRIELAFGHALPLLGQLRAGWRETKVTNQLETGSDLLSLLPERSVGGWLAGLDLDGLDRLYFPRSGYSAAAEWFQSDQRGFTRAALDLRAALPVGAGVLGARAGWVGSPRGALPASEAGKLGGFLNLTGFAAGQLVGDEVAYAHLRAERIIGRLPLGLRGDMRLGVALEAGRVGVPYAVQKRDGWLKSLALYLGGETPLGAVYLGVGRGSGGSTNAYLVIGTP
jgi:NTE family protein